MVQSREVKILKNLFAFLLYTMTIDVLYMGWLRLVGSLKLQVSLAEYSLFYRALLQKRPTILRSLLIIAHESFYFLSIYHDYRFTIYGVATIGRFLKIKGLFCKRAL